MPTLETEPRGRGPRLTRKRPVHLLLDGQKPDLVYQKQYDTFAKRHHLRIFHRPDQFQGRDVWVCSATHDIGIDFSTQDRTFIHKIDSKIDNERAKVVNDLLFTGLVKGQALVARPKVPPAAKTPLAESWKPTANWLC
jgi:hypothetical protein